MFEVGRAFTGTAEPRVYQRRNGSGTIPGVQRLLPALRSPLPAPFHLPLPAPCSLSSFAHPLPLELRHLQRPRRPRQKAPGLEGPRAPAAHGVVPRAQLDPDAVPQPLRKLARPAAVHARRHHRELGGPDAAERIGATPARLEQPRDAAQRIEAIAPVFVALMAGSDCYAGHRRVVPRRLEDQLTGAARQTLRRVQAGHVVHEIPTRYAVSLDLDEHVAVQFAEQLAHVQWLAHQLPHARAQRGEMVLTTGTRWYEQQNRRARADRRIGAERAAQIEGLSVAEPGIEYDDIGARRARPLEHGGLGEHAQHGVPASAERSDDVREGVVLIAGDEDPRRTGETRSNRHETWGVD